MQMRINGEERDVQAADIDVLLKELGLNADHVAIELNHDILLPADFAQTPLAAGDTIEIIQFVGGG